MSDAIYNEGTENSEEKSMKTSPAEIYTGLTLVNMPILGSVFNYTLNLEYGMKGFISVRRIV